eukprot:TRINITY_DN18961_c0_g1_i1.p1 TRINITY_DN18961_c0_g1~~TRINITY_DN18961_c0_g1_i1.p1  ORF type:complete len:566 (+),score=45.76 TRINITY_DN18961_c0_g1_i1:613-2310(+)
MGFSNPCHLAPWPLSHKYVVVSIFLLQSSLHIFAWRISPLSQIPHQSIVDTWQTEPRPDTLPVNCLTISPGCDVEWSLTSNQEIKSIGNSTDIHLWSGVITALVESSSSADLSAVLASFQSQDVCRSFLELGIVPLFTSKSFAGNEAGSNSRWEEQQVREGAPLHQEKQQHQNRHQQQKHQGRFQPLVCRDSRWYMNASMQQPFYLNSSPVHSTEIAAVEQMGGGSRTIRQPLQYLGSPNLVLTPRVDVTQQGVEEGGDVRPSMASVRFTFHARILRSSPLYDPLSELGGLSGTCQRSSSASQQGGWRAADVSIIDWLHLHRRVLTHRNGTTHRKSRAVMALETTHATLNSVSWGLAMPIGAMCSRYGRPVSTFYWHQVHVFIQLCSYCVGTVGFGLGLSLLSRRIEPDKDFLHLGFGIAIFILASMQIFAIVWRPLLDAPLRPLWNLYHGGVGYVLLILSLVNVYKGFSLLEGEPLEFGENLYNVAIICVGSTAACLEVLLWMRWFRMRHLAQDKERIINGGEPNRVVCAPHVPEMREIIELETLRSRSDHRSDEPQYRSRANG